MTLGEDADCFLFRRSGNIGLSDELKVNQSTVFFPLMLLEFVQHLLLLLLQESKRTCDQIFSSSAIDEDMKSKCQQREYIVCIIFIYHLFA